MWTLENAQLPIVASPNNLAPISTFKTGDSLASLAQIDFQANYTLPGLQVVASPTIGNAITTGNTVNIGSLVQVDAIEPPQSQSGRVLAEDGRGWLKGGFTLKFREKQMRLR